MSNNQSALCFNLDFSLPFYEAIKDLRSVHGRKMYRSSHNYHVLYALFTGDVIDDYENKPVGDDGKTIHNIRSRISDLQNKYNIEIESERVEEGRSHVQYWIDRGEAS